jgi:hypothetical protein
MKSNSNVRAYFYALLVLGALWAFPACKSKYPTRALPLSDVLSSSRVMDFEAYPAGSPATIAAVNPLLAEAGVPGNVIQRPGMVKFTGGGTAALIAASGAVGTARCLQVSGTLTAARLQLTVPLDTLSSTGYYNAHFFSGVRFYQKVSASDAATPRYFSMPTAQTMPPPEGMCVAPGCYNHFGANYDSTDDQWESVVLDFASFTRGGWGDPVEPTTFSGTNLEEIVQLQWQEDNPVFAIGGSCNVDFSIDEIEFY